MNIQQLSFNFEEYKIKIKKKRIRYKVPTYKKFYSLYQYNRELFKKLNKERLRGENAFNQEQILEQCYVRDENGNKIKDSDEKHIFRIAVLHRIHTELYKLIERQDFKTPKLKVQLLIYEDEEQVEIKDTWMLSIYERLKLHINLLKQLKLAKI